MAELFELSATEVLSKFSSRELSPVEYLQALIDRSLVVEPIINAFGDTYFEQAMVSAEKSAQNYVDKKNAVKKLEGLPIAVKDEADIVGQRTTNGSLIWQNNIATSTDPMVERLLEAGAYVHARTLTPEFSIAFWTLTKMWGATRNPWNPKFDVGGSSGGSGASLAAGTTPLATGSDIGGSIRVPASCNGVVGYKPPHGRVPHLAPWGLDQWCHAGPLGRTVNDVALMYDQISGFHRRAGFSTSPKTPIGIPNLGVNGMRIAYSPDLGDWPTDDAVRASLENTVSSLRQAGAVVEQVDLQISRQMVRDASNAHGAVMFGDFIAQAVRNQEHLANSYTLQWLDSLKDAPSYRQGLELEGQIWQSVSAVFEHYQVLLCPSNCVPALDAGVDYVAERYAIDGVSYDPMHDLFPAEVFNVTAVCPVISVPTGRNQVGVPTGTQIVGRPDDEETVFRVAATIENIQPWPLVAHFG